MASGLKTPMSGSFVGSGAAIDVRTVGFRPKVVMLTNMASADEARWQEGMADASAMKRLAAGASSVITSGGITPLSDGFRLGTDTDLNVSGELVRFLAFE